MKENGVVALHLPIGLLKPLSGLKPVLRCEPTTYSPLADDLAFAPSRPVMFVSVIYEPL